MLCLRQERLANEWGIHSDVTKELMLKRARKMKGRKKKEITAKDKLRKFQEFAQTFANQPLPTQQKQLNSGRKVEYFKGRNKR